MFNSLHQQMFDEDITNAKLPLTHLLSCFASKKSIHNHILSKNAKNNMVKVKSLLQYFY